MAYKYHPSRPCIDLSLPPCLRPPNPRPPKSLPLPPASPETDPAMGAAARRAPEQEQSCKATEDFDTAKPPPFRIGDVRAAVPAHCWRKSPLRSLSYVARDLAAVAALALLAWGLDSWVVWPLYWAAQGTLFWALFVLGHDCGHGSFSDRAGRSTASSATCCTPSSSSHTMDGGSATGHTIRTMATSTRTSHGTRSPRMCTRSWSQAPRSYASRYHIRSWLSLSTCGTEARARTARTSTQAAICSAPRRGVT
ncbi:hypothetical protein ACQ4PT_030877 [Festuca glaucescens]